KAALDRDPGFGLARVLYVFEGAVPASQQTAELNRGVADAARGTTKELLLAMAWRELAENRTATAKTLFDAATEMMPEDAFLASTAATIGLSGGPQATYAAARQVAMKFPDYGPAYNTLAYSAWAAGDHAGALQAAEKQVQLTHNNPNAHDTYGELMQWSGKFPEALHHYGEAVELDSSFTEALIGMAEVEALQRHFEKARSYVNQAISRTSLPLQKVIYMRDLAGTYALVNDRKGGVAVLEKVGQEAKAQNDGRTAAIAMSQIAASYANMGDAKSAHAYLDMAHADHPELDAAVSFFAAMTHGLLKHWGPSTAAIAAAKAAPDAAPNAERIAAAEAFLATAQGKPADAIALLAKADLTDPLVAGRLAEAYAASGNAADAMRLQQQIANDYALNLLDWPAVSARARAHTYIDGMTKKKK
ncbi:MAG TPA: hypothetical protein VFC35_08935, partial [Gemmatimonadaceae bacterium]|nr:hypothetical protein [Gemmatimonadaceae bacterium]